MAANNSLETATSANWNLIYRARRIIFAPIAISLSHSVVSAEDST
jgi:hypothetical protein